MGQSITLPSRMGQTIPTWARYSVQICHSVTFPGRPDVLSEPEQYFSNKYDAERFAFACSDYFTAASGESSLSPQWALVNALAATNATRVSVGARHCYLSIDAARTVVKRHAITRGFYGAKCERCAQSVEAI